MQTIEPVKIPINRVVINLQKNAAEVCKVLNNPKYKLFLKLSFEEKVEGLLEKARKIHFPNYSIYDLPEPGSTDKLKFPKEAFNDPVKSFGIALTAAVETKLENFNSTIKTNYTNFLNAENSLRSDVDTIAKIYNRDRRRFESLNLPKSTLNALSDIFLVIADDTLKTGRPYIVCKPLKVSYKEYEEGSNKYKNKTREMIQVSYPEDYDFFIGMSRFFKNLASRTQ